MKLSDVRSTLQEIHVSPVKTLGQNFLHDQNVARWIVDQAEITSDDYVLEIGPGLGALTKLILDKGAGVLAIEKDARLANFLHKRFANGRVEILNIDALKNDRILRHASRSDVHANNLRHRAVHILIFNPAGEVYLQQRSRWKDRHPLKWDSSAAGHVTGAESYDETARRELKEELGIGVPLTKISKLPASERTDQEFVWLYRGKLAGTLSPDAAEIETGAFFPETVVDGWVAARPEDFAPGFIECWKIYRQKNCRNRSGLT
jgi:isopentenyldiphosphate isomerase